jgi:hypothetical protein
VVWLTTNEKLQKVTISFEEVFGGKQKQIHWTEEETALTMFRHVLSVAKKKQWVNNGRPMILYMWE